MVAIRVYRADLSLLSAETCFPLLSKEEQQRAAGLSNRHARHEFVKARALLRLLLSQQTGWPAGTLKIASGRCGKPVLLGAPGLHFNVSHSGGMVLIAISSAGIGIDIERMHSRVDYLDVAESVFSSAESELLRNATPDRQGDVFFSIWTRKEAYLKATGLGFSSDLPAISTARQSSAIEDRSSAGKHAWHAFEVPAPAGFKAALVTASSECEIEVVDMTASIAAAPALAPPALAAIPA